MERISMGVPAANAAPDARASLRRALGIPPDGFVFVAFGRVTAEKRIASALRALARLRAEGCPARLLLIGDAGGPIDSAALSRATTDLGVAESVHAAGYVPDEAIGDYLAAADACLCLRWPTAQESSASWLRCLAAGRPTVISDLAHLADIPTVDVSRGGGSAEEPTAVAARVDLVDEDASLTAAMRRLAADRRFADDLGRRGHAYWKAGHTL